MTAAIDRRRILASMLLFALSGATLAQAVLVKELNPGSAAGLPTGINFYTGVVGTNLLFMGIDPINGKQPWRSDGSTGGTSLARGIIGSSGFTVQNFGAVGNYWYFAANDGFNGHQLWRSDGSFDGTIAVSPVNGRMFSSTGQAYGNDLVFTLDTNNDSNYELWRSNGAMATPVASNYVVVGGMATVGNRLLFACSSVSEPHGLCAYDGSSVTRLLTWAEVGNPNGVSGLTAVNDRVYFSAETAANGYELWVSDLSAAGTMMVRDILTGPGASAPARLTRVDDRLFFVAGEPSAGREIWRSDGSQAGTVRVTDVRPGIQDGVSARTLIGFDGRLLFEAHNGVDGWQPWVTDGTTSSMLGTFGTTYGVGRAFGPFALFTANGVPMISDGTPAGTQAFDPDFRDGAEIVPAGGVVFMPGSTSATQFTQGIELWKANVSDRIGLSWCSDPEQVIFDQATTTARIALNDTRPLLDLDVRVDLYHARLADLALSLRHVDTGTVVALKAANTCGTGKLLDMKFDSQAGSTLAATCTSNRYTVAANSVLRPSASLGAFTGQSFGGNWELIMTDNTAGNSGTLHSWCLHATELTPEIFRDSFEG